MLSLVFISALAAAVIIAYPLWLNGSTSTTIVKGQNATFDVSFLSQRPPMSYTAYLYDASNNQLLNTIGSGSSSIDFDQRITVTPANYNNRGGTFFVRIVSSDSLTSQSNDELTLIVIQQAPSLSSIPDINMSNNSAYTLNLSQYVTDSDDPIGSMAWTVTGNTLATASISNGMLTLSSGSALGSETLNVTVCDPSDACASETFGLTVSGNINPPTPTVKKKVNEINVKDVNVQLFGDQLLLRTRGMKIDDVKLKVNIESNDAPSNSFRFDLSPNVVRYITLDTEGLESGDYLAEVQISADDSTNRGYLILSV